MAQCPSLKTLTLWDTKVLERVPDLTTIPNLQIDGVPEQLQEWEEEQKKKRADDIREGKNKGPVVKASGWAVRCVSSNSTLP